MASTSSSGDLLRHAVENVCRARHFSEKLRLFHGAREYLDGPLFALWQHHASALDDDDATNFWLASSLADPAALLVKYLLLASLRQPGTPDADPREHAGRLLDELTHDALVVLRCPPAQPAAAGVM